MQARSQMRLTGAHRPLALLLAWLAHAASGEVHQGPFRWRQCLDYGFKASERRMPKPAWGADGTLVKKIIFGVCEYEWTSQELPTMIARILTEEVLGIHAEYVYLSDVLPTWLAMAGCPDFNDWECDETSYDELNPAFHVGLGAWHPYSFAEVADYLDAEQIIASQRDIKALGSIGFVDMDSDFMMKDVIDDALAHDGLDMIWGPLIKNGVRFFTPLADMNTSGGLYQSCEDEHDYHDLLLEKGYLCNSSAGRDPWRTTALDGDGNAIWDPSGDSPLRIIPAYDCSYDAPGEDLDVAPGWICFEDGYWASPACQRLGNVTENCIVYADYGAAPSWRLDIRQTWERFAIPILYVLDGEWQTHADLAQDYYLNGNRIMFNWWLPDVSIEMAFAHADRSGQVYLPMPRQVVYPPGEGGTGGMPTKVMRREVQAASKELVYMLERFVITDNEMARLHMRLAIMAANTTDLEEAFFNVTCEWVRRNRYSTGMSDSRPWSHWLMKEETCIRGTSWNPDTASCDECPRGKTSELGAPCSDCSAGTFCSRLGTDAPVICPEGKYCEAGSIYPADCPSGTRNPAKGGHNQSSCISCEVGTYMADYGAQHCANCSLGLYQNETGQSQCSRCPRGMLADSPGMSECKTCPEDTTTEESGCDSEGCCMCPPTTYLSAESGKCIACGEGSFCRGFGAAPEAIEGFQLHGFADSRLSIFKCFHDPRRCPGGLVGTCSSGRDGVACAACMQDMADAGDGSCQACSSSDKGPFVVAVVFCTLALSAVYIKTCLADSERTGKSLIVTVLMAAQIVSVAQLLGVSFKMSVVWKPPISHLLAVMRIFNFDIQVFRVGCVGHFSVLSMYILTLFVAPIGLAFVGIVHAVKVLLFNGGAFASHHHTFFGTCGVLLMTFFVTISTTIMSPFQCQKHPNDEWTLLQYEAQRCWQGGDHSSMMIVGSLAIILPIGFICQVAHLLRIFPQKMSEGDVRFLNTYAFVFLRVKPHTRWFMLVYLLRNMLIAVVPSIPNSFWQVFCMQCLFLATIASVAFYQPWRLPIVNLMEVVISCMLLLLMCIAGFFVTSVDLQGMAEVGFVAILISFLAFPIYACVALFMRRFKSKPFRFFLCHHKAGAGTFARLLKIVLLEQDCKGGVFLDSDNLADLEQLFSCVAQEVDTLVVLATREIFLRPWCLGEVATANMCKTQVVPVHFADFVMPDQEFIANIDSIVDMTVLTESSLSVDNVRLSLVAFPSHTHIDGTRPFERSWPPALARMLLAKNEEARTSLQPKQKSTSTIDFSQKIQPRVILVDTTSSEATAAALIVIKLLQGFAGAAGAIDLPRLYEEAIDNAEPAAFRTTKLSSQESNLMPTTSKSKSSIGGSREIDVLVLLCTSNCFSKELFLQGLVWAMSRGVSKALPVAVADSFQFPTESFYCALAERTERLCSLAGTDIVPGLLTKYTEAIFKKIAVPLSTMGSSHVLESQAHMLWGRLNGTAKENSSFWSIPEEHKKVVEEVLALSLSDDSSMVGLTSTKVSSEVGPVACRQDLHAAVGALEATKSGQVPPELVPRLEAIVAALQNERSETIVDFHPGRAVTETFHRGAI